ncbi:MAG: circularly permuted type 2 ATP-grasp protein [Hahellaceae bacterium]|nr:circularly permuted type 2 ATP-grasp protein [Hahellaceae bacterium]
MCWRRGWWLTRGCSGHQANGFSPCTLARFYQHLKRHLAALSTDRCREPTIVLLSSGVRQREVYFRARAYMAAQLGVTVVRGDDPTVRQGGIYLKTIQRSAKSGRHHPARRVDDSYCDPLSVRSDSMLQGCRDSCELRCWVR